jgi:hypothetical protein
MHKAQIAADTLTNGDRIIGTDGLTTAPVARVDASDPQRITVYCLNEDREEFPLTFKRDELVWVDERDTELEPVAELVDEDDDDVMPCVTCGERPWGFGYCGEECETCANKTD